MSTGGTKTRRFFIFPSLSGVPKVNLAAEQNIHTNRDEHRLPAVLADELEE